MTESRSALVVTVRPALVQWVRQQGIRRPHIAEEDCVWLIPPMSGFVDEAAFASYLDGLKDLILDSELERFGKNLRKKILAEHSFDDLIEIEIRDHVEVAPGA